MIIELRQIFGYIISQSARNSHPFPKVTSIEQEKLELFLIGKMGRVYTSPKEEYRYTEKHRESYLPSLFQKYIHRIIYYFM